jgi:hypothetical protein
MRDTNTVTWITQLYKPTHSAVSFYPSLRCYMRVTAATSHYLTDAQHGHRRCILCLCPGHCYKPERSTGVGVWAHLPHKASKPWLAIEPNSVQHSSAILRFDSVNKLGSKQGFLTPVRDTTASEV